MYLQRNYRVSRTLATWIVLSLLLMSVGKAEAAQIRIVEENDQQEAPELAQAQTVEEKDQQETLEEVIVYGKKSMKSFRLDLYRAQDKFYDTFNSLNDDDEYDIRCNREAPIGSLIKQRVCQAIYVNRALAKDAQALLKGIPTRPAAGIIFSKSKIFNAKMEKLTTENPMLLQSLIAVDNASNALVSEQKRRCEGRLFLCRK